jgi:N-acetylmuramoyl-L-alanine amidase
MKLKVLITATVAMLMFNNAQADSASTFQNAIKGEIYTAESQPELYCLAMNIYHEARAESIAGQYAVADVTINRTLDTRYPNTVCKVVMQAKMKESWKTKQYPDLSDSQRKYIPVRNKCQFSWYCDGRSDTVHDGDAWRKAQEVAYRIVVEKKYRGITEGSTHYHADYVSPRWAKAFDLVGRVGTHIFYRWAR